MSKSVVLMIVAITVVICMYCMYNTTNSPQINQARLLLATVRDGDYAHPGDSEAVEMIINELKKIDPYIHNRKTLDIGCGFGGTLNLFKKNMFKDVRGIDIDQSAIEYARKKYPEINFEIEDITNLSLELEKLKFQLITLFSVAYSIYDKRKIVDAITKISEKNAIVVIFDYAACDDLPVKDFAQKEMYPIQIDQLTKQLESRNWAILKTQDLSTQFLNWYEIFINKLEKQESKLKTQFSRETYQKVHSTFSYFIDMLKRNKLSGSVIYAKKL